MRGMITKPAPIEVFYAASDADQALCAELDKHLISLQREGLITTWHQHRIAPGEDTQATIDQHLTTAHLILLLISPDFMSTTYATGSEVERAMRRHGAGEVRVIPVVLRPVDWQNTPFGKLQPLPEKGKPITTWSDRDEAFMDVAKGIRAVLENWRDAVAPPTVVPGAWNIPFPRNPVFTGREDVLAQLADALKTGQPAALSQAQAISGLGGIGKTQIAIEYAYQHRREYWTVLWTRADTREALVSGYVALAALLGLPEKDEQEQAIIVQAVMRWLTTEGGWLLILDNADDLELAREFLPPAFQGHILLTTRAQTMGRLARRIQVDALEQDAGALLLLRRADLLAPDAPLKQASAADRALAKAICQELGGLPLALDQAGAYIEETKCSLTEYQQLFQTHRADLLRERGGLIDDHPDSVATTWSLAFAKVEQSNPAAADLLRFCAFLHPDAIPEEIITDGAEHLGSRLQPVAADPFAFNKAIAALNAYSLLHRDPEEKTLSVHRLVQAVLKDTMDEAIQHEWIERAVLALDAAFPRADLLTIGFTTWQQCERFLPHALACTILIEQRDIMLPQATNLLASVGWYLQDRARYNEAELLLVQSLAMRERMLGPDHKGTAAALNNLAHLYWEQGKYKQAESLWVRVLSIDEQQLGVDHPNTASSLNNLATLYDSQGKYNQAEPLHLRALVIYEKQLRADHRDMANSLNNLAVLYYNKGKYEKAEPLLEQALAIHKKQLGTGHPNTASSFNNLAMLYQEQGKYEKAEPLLEQALAIYEEQLGADHPTTTRILNSLIDFYYTQGKYDKAISVLMNNLARREGQTDPGHSEES